MGLRSSLSRVVAYGHISNAIRMDFGIFNVWRHDDDIQCLAARRRSSSCSPSYFEFASLRHSRTFTSQI
ncbi:uncharacterized protein J3R85_008984 [Psidium guajava]|nr:uncharacterized protein J3R85_008984 [Psidium guajava]